MHIPAATTALLLFASALPAADTTDQEKAMAAQIDASILKHRTAEATVTVLSADGRPLANAQVTVRQTRHKFLFGCNAYMLGHCGKPDVEKAYRDRFAALLNYATLPFYWGSFERVEGRPDTQRLREMATWCKDRGIRAKGHPLCWHSVCPQWLRTKSEDQVEAAQWARITRDVTAFRGLIDTWDVVNEAVVMPDNEGGANPIAKLCRRHGRAGLIAKCFALARAANANATLLLNDFIVDKRYEDLLAECIKAEVPIDVIGIQSHMHNRYWGAAKAADVCRRFAALGKPLHFTELTILSGALKTDSDWERTRTDWVTTPEGEKRQAREVVELYRTLFAQPAVEAITWWDFSDLGAWQGAPAGLVRKDMTPKPAYDALLKLVKGDWWTGPTALATDAAGRATFRGFLGDYAAEAAGGTATFRLDKAGEASLTVRLGKP
jgi:endo-1,4-beta-xylanase